MPQDMMAQPTHPHAAALPAQMHAPVNSYYPENPNDLTGGLPINLDSLRDGPPGSKPFYPYSTLIRYAIKGAPNQKLLLEDIYYAIESRFPYFRNAPPGWKNSVRHNLSLNPCFEKVPRPLTDRGKGSYWTVNDNVDPRTGVHRIRKKKGKGPKGGSPPMLEADIDYHHSVQPQNGAQQHVPPPDPNAYDPNAQYIQQPPPPMGPDGAGPSRQQMQAPYVQYPPAFDPSFGMMAPPPPPGPPGMRYMPPMFPGEENIEHDEQGNVDWHAEWRKELDTLNRVTDDQEKAGADQEWYRTMLIRVRTALMPTENVVQVGAPGMPQTQPVDAPE